MSALRLVVDNDPPEEKPSHVFHAFAWALKVIFWLPMLTIYFSEQRVRRFKNLQAVLAFLGWVFLAIGLVFELFGPESSWVPQTTSIALHYLLGGVSVLALHDKGPAVSAAQK